MQPPLAPAPPALVAPSPAPPAASPAPTPLDGLGDDLARAFGGVNLVLYAGATAGSAAMALGGADQAIRVAVQQRLASAAYGNAANLTGYLLPEVVASAVWLTGLAVGDHPATGAGSAAVQALAVTVLTDAALKIGVGRGYPLAGRSPTAPDRLDHPEDARAFRPFQSVAWPLPAWPSGHASSAVSVVAALTAYHAPDELWIPLVGYPVAAAIALGMIVGDEHWTSDVLAGAVLGQCVGWSIGRAFRSRRTGEAAPPVAVVPTGGAGWQGVGVVGVW